jgi:hypothetical protein
MYFLINTVKTNTKKHLICGQILIENSSTKTPFSEPKSNQKNRNLHPKVNQNNTDFYTHNCVANHKFYEPELKTSNVTQPYP